MSKIVKILKYFVIFIFITIITDCAPAKKNPYLHKRQEESRVNTSQLGRNRYYFSSSYQKRLNKSYKKKKY